VDECRIISVNHIRAKVDYVDQTPYDETIFLDTDTLVNHDITEMYDILEKQLADRPYLCGDTMTMAEIPAGSLTHRWLHWLPDPPSHPNVKAWYDRLAARPAFQTHVIDANEPRTKALPWRN